MSKRRAEHQAGYVLHTYPYKETSLIVEAFTRNFGRVALLARGARRPRSAMRGVLLSFHPLRLGWSASAELGNLISAEWSGALQPLSGRGLMCGFYLNELLLKLLAREDPHPSLFEDYAAALQALVTEPAGAPQAAVLRRFEVRLLAAMGYAMQLTRDVDNASIDPVRMYNYAPDRGPRLVVAHVAREPGAHPRVVRGSTLLALAAGSFPDAESAADAKRLMRDVLDHHLDERRIVSRRVVRDLVSLEEGME